MPRVLLFDKFPNNFKHFFKIFLDFTKITINNRVNDCNALYNNLSNFYNPFTIGNYKLYVHPNRMYKIKYPSSWMVEEAENRDCLMDFNGKVE